MEVVEAVAHQAVQAQVVHQVAQVQITAQTAIQTQIPILTIRIPTQTTRQTKNTIQPTQHDQKLNDHHGYSQQLQPEHQQLELQTKRTIRTKIPITKQIKPQPQHEQKSSDHHDYSVSQQLELKLKFTT